MQKVRIGLAIWAAAILAAPAAAAITPGKVQTFKDWAVGCDNGLDCEAVALTTEQTVEGRTSIVLKLPAGPLTSLAIIMSPERPQVGRYSINVDRRPILRGNSQNPNDLIQITGASAMKLVRAMARGSIITVSDETGNETGKASLAGTVATLRYMDAQQGRAGTRNAIIATGRKTRAISQPPVPVISARKIRPTNMLPDTAALIAFSESISCAAERFEATQDTAYSLGTGPDGPRALILLNCGAGAYNSSSGVYTARRNMKGTWAFAPAKFDYGATGFTSISEIPILVNADWDAAKQSLGSYTKARGLGDCGSSESYVWDGEMFRLTAASLMSECRGSTDWIPTWRAEVRLTP